MCLLCTYLIIGQATWLKGQFKNPFCHTSNHLRALCFISCEHFRASSVKAVSLSQRKWAERILPRPSVKSWCTSPQFVKLSELRAVVMISKVFPFLSVTAHLLPGATSVSSQGFGMVVLPPTVPEHWAALRQLSLSRSVHSDTEGSYRKVMKGTRDLRMIHCGNCQLCTTWILFKSCLVVVPQWRKSSIKSRF